MKEKLAMTDAQREIVLKESNNMLVSASAGSGKTFTMIERVKRLVLEKGVSVDNILAVTFTETAAQDMKAKLKNALSEKSKDFDQTRIYRQLALIPSSDISTLHAFCARLIRSYFFTVGLSPDFAVMDEADAKVMRSDCVDKTFKLFYEQKQGWFNKLVDRHATKRSDESLKQMILQAYAFCDSEENPFMLMDKVQDECDPANCDRLLAQYKQDLNFELLPLIEKCKTALTILQKDELVKAIEYTNALLIDMQNIVDSQDVYAVKKTIAVFSLRLNFERNLTSEQEILKETVKEIKERFKKLVNRFSSNLAQNRYEEIAKMQTVSMHAQSFANVLKTFSDIYSQEKRQENLLDFNDLEHFALQILSDESVRQEVSNKYQYIFVDEYQDINSVQEKIISLLSNDNVFMVGDVKQSIYGFRGCRPEFFSQKEQTMLKDKKAFYLNQNFRSATKVIDMVNTIFSYSMTERYFGFNYKDASKLISGGVYPNEQTGRASLHLLLKQEKAKKDIETPRVYDILQEIKGEKELEDNNTASLIVKIINEELGKEYYDLKDKKSKKVEYKDITILTRNRNNKFVAGIVKGLIAHGIPVVSDVKENVCDYQEILMVVNALKLVDCFKQDVALASTLKSPIGGLNDDELAQIVAFYTDTEEAQKDWRWGFADAYEYYVKHATTPLSTKVKEFNEYFEKIREIADFVGAEGVLNALINDKNIESYLFAQKNGSTKVNRLRRLVCASVVDAKRLTVSEFLQKVQTSPESFNFADCADEDSVKILTIHASKGLEFPVVIVCGLERQMNNEEEHGDLLFSRQKGFAFKCFNDENRTKSETLIRGVIKESMRRDRVREELRLFYVALTRATFSLNLILEGKEEVRSQEFFTAERFIDYLPNTIAYTLHDPQELEFTQLKAETRKVIIGQSQQQIVESMRKRFEYQYPHLTDTTLPLKMGVTSAVKSEDQSLVHLLFDEPSPDAERGIIAHLIMENYNFNSTDTIYQQVQGMIDSGIIDKTQTEKINLDRLNSVISSGAFDEIKGCKLYREKEFLVNVEAQKLIGASSNEQILVQGIIDLLAIEKNNKTAVVVDYKYSSLDKNSLKIKYSKQLELYTYAVEKVLNVKVNKMVIVNLFTGEIVKL